MTCRRSYQLAHKNLLSFLGQKAKVRWLEEGDDNTRLFHKSIRMRRVQNRINTIQNERGEWVSKPEDVSEAFLQFYKSLLGSSGLTRPLEEIIINQGKVVSEEQKVMLNLQFSSDELKQALFSIPDEKSPGIDSYTSLFFKKAWEIVGLDVIEAIKDFFTHGKLLSEVNVTAITLVPKVKCPATVSDYRPIACWNILYKTITKLISTRLNIVLPNLVSPNKGAFITGRSIISNILLCQDLVKRFNSRGSKMVGVMMKIDLRKAYDSIEWAFVEDLLKILQFPSHFIKCVMKCIKTPSFTLMLKFSYVEIVCNVTILLFITTYHLLVSC